MMSDEDEAKQLTELFTDPLFKIGFFIFFSKMQTEGIDAARKFWFAYADKNDMVPNAGDVIERMIDFYTTLGFVPRIKYEDIQKENNNLKTENKFLKEIVQEVQQGFLREIGEKGLRMGGRISSEHLSPKKQIDAALTSQTRIPATLQPKRDAL